MSLNGAVDLGYFGYTILLIMVAKETMSPQNHKVLLARPTGVPQLTKLNVKFLVFWIISAEIETNP